MDKDMRQGISEKKWKKWFQKENLVVLILGGILLFIIALPVETSTGDQTQAGSEGQRSILTLSDLEGQENLGQNAYSQASLQTGDTDEEYAAYLEERLRSILVQMADVGKVEVMITLQSSRELVVEKEEPMVRSSTSETDSQGGSREVSEMDSGQNTVYRTDGDVSEPYVVKTLVPEIEGVLVVAEGAGSGTVSHSIVEIVQALFGVDAHKVKVVKMQDRF